MKLYYMPGACSLASHIVLREAGIDFEIEKVNPVTKETEKGADYIKINPKGYVPALRLDDGEVLTESAAVLQYIADTHPESDLAPSPGTLSRARLQEHLNYISSELLKSFVPYFVPGSREDARHAAKADIERKMDYFESIFSDGREYLVGDKFSISDAYFFVVTSWTNHAGVDLRKWPHISAFSARIAEREKVRDAMQAEGLLN